MGDLIHTLPALTDAKKAIPDIQFDWVAEEGFAEIPTWHPAVDTVIPIAVRRWRKNPIKTYLHAEISAFKAQLQQQDYDYVIDAQGLLKSALITRWVDAKSYGMDRKSAREAMASFFYDEKISVTQQLHAIERVRILFAKILGYDYVKSSLDYGLLSSRFPVRSCQRPYLVFLHGTSRDSKLWPESQWLKLIEQAIAASYTIYLPWGNDNERERAERLSQGRKYCQVLNKLSLTEMAGLLSEASGVVGVDTGLAHLSAALSIPAMVLYVDTYPGLTGACGLNQTCITQMPEIEPAVKTAGLETVYCQEIKAEDVWLGLQRKLKS